LNNKVRTNIYQSRISGAGRVSGGTLTLSAETLLLDGFEAAGASLAIALADQAGLAFSTTDMVLEL
jgi:hypothetical protein